jgi:hypothetical protein
LSFWQDFLFSLQFLGCKARTWFLLLSRLSFFPPLPARLSGRGLRPWILIIYKSNSCATSHYFCTNTVSTWFLKE